MVEMEPVDRCPICGGAGTFDIEGYELAIPIRMCSCSECGTAYHNPRMSKCSMTEYYNSGAYRAIHETHSEYEISRANRLMFLMDWFTRYDPPPARCLDVGCSRGHLARKLAERYGAESIGYDIYVDPQAVVDVVDSKELITGKFDLITCVHVLEHFYDPLAELDWMIGLLNTGGALVLEIPMVKKVMLAHPIIFSKKAVALMMQRAGLRHVLMDIPSRHIGIIFAQKGVA